MTPVTREELNIRKWPLYFAAAFLLYCFKKQSWLDAAKKYR